jgi:hypothetical protein
MKKLAVVAADASLTNSHPEAVFNHQCINAQNSGGKRHGKCSLFPWNREIFTSSSGIGVPKAQDLKVVRIGILPRGLLQGPFWIWS